MATACPNYTITFVRLMHPMILTYLCISRPPCNLWHLSDPGSAEHICEDTAAPGMSDEEN